LKESENRVVSIETTNDSTMEEGDEDEGDDEYDDFLARELGEEDWG